jgi:DNA-binding NtrC family response regulator
MTRTRKPRKPAKRPRGGPRTYGRLQRALDDAARREIKAVLKETGGQVVAAATALGVSKVALWKRMRALGIKAKGSGRGRAAVPATLGSGLAFQGNLS